MADADTPEGFETSPERREIERQIETLRMLTEMHHQALRTVAQSLKLGDAHQEARSERLYLLTFPANDRAKLSEQFDGGHAWLENDWEDYDGQVCFAVVAFSPEGESWLHHQKEVRAVARLREPVEP
jgi:hypothetical protein